MTEVPAGWYDDGHGAWRYWDGAQWTEYTAPGASSAGDASSSVGDVSSSVGAAQSSGNPTPQVWPTAEVESVAAGGQAGYSLAAQASLVTATSAKGLLVGVGAVVLAVAIGGTVFALVGGDSGDGGGGFRAGTNQTISTPSAPLGSGSGGFNAGPDPMFPISENCPTAGYNSGGWEQLTVDCFQQRLTFTVYGDGTVVSDVTSYYNAEALLRAGGWDGTGSVADAAETWLYNSDVDAEEILDGPLGNGYGRDYLTPDQAAALQGGRFEIRGHVAVGRIVWTGQGLDALFDWSIEKGDGISLQLNPLDYSLLPDHAVVVTITLPSDVTDTNGTVNGRTVTWSSFDEVPFVTFEG